MPSSGKMRRKHGYKYNREYYMKAIIIEVINGKEFGRGPYHNIRDSNSNLNKFMAVMKEYFPNATHINFYGGISGHFIKQLQYNIDVPAQKKWDISFFYTWPSFVRQWYGL